MTSFKDVNAQTITLVSGLYKRLRARQITKKESQNLERSLSESVLEAEESILRYSKIMNLDLLDQFKRRRALLKRVADGLAWRYFGFDEHSLSLYALGPAPGYMYGKVGYKTERLVMKSAYLTHRVTFAIQNDVTNTLRMGDITLLIDEGSILSVEVKGSKKRRRDRRTERQLARAEAVLKYLAEERTKGIEHFLPIPTSTIGLPFTRRYYWSDFEGIAKQALQKGCAYACPDPAVQIGACTNDFVSTSMRLADLIERSRQTAWKARARIRIASLNEHLLPLDNSLLRCIRPITSFEVDPSIIGEMLAGNLIVWVLINQDLISKRLRFAGIESEIERHTLRLKIPDTRLESYSELQERPWLWLSYALWTVESFIEYLQRFVIAMPATLDRIEIDALIRGLLLVARELPDKDAKFLMLGIGTSLNHSHQGLTTSSLVTLLRRLKTDEKWRVFGLIVRSLRSHRGKIEQMTAQLLQEHGILYLCE